MATYLLVILVALCAVPAEGACPAGFEHQGDTCYRFVKLQRSWEDAQFYCLINYGAHLATIETAAENKYLNEYIASNSHTLFGYDIWLGAKDDNPEKIWRWVVTDNEPLTFTDWAKNQPDSSYGGLEKCLEFEAQYGLKWNDDECEDHNVFICERPFNPPVPTLPGIGR